MVGNAFRSLYSRFRTENYVFLKNAQVIYVFTYLLMFFVAVIFRQYSVIFLSFHRFTSIACVHLGFFAYIDSALRV